MMSGLAPHYSPTALAVATSDDVPSRLMAVRETIETRREDVLAILTEISTHRAVGYEIDAALRTLDGAMTEIERFRPPRVGSIAVFLPSNVLLYSYILYLLVPSLYADSVVFRPSIQVKGTAAKLHELLAPVHNLPIELRDVSQRAFVETDVSDADVVVFTGTYQNAETIRHSLRPAQLMAFLGAGVNPVVIAPGADVERAVADVVDIRMLNSGQDCLAPDIIWVHHSLYDEVLTRLSARVAALRHGPPGDPEADYTSLAYESALLDGVDYLSRNRDAIHVGGRVHLAEARVEPTIVTWRTPKAARIAEFFAPIFNVCSYTDERAAVQTMTSGMYAERALGASVYGQAPDLVAALRKWHTVTVDESLLAVDDGNLPFGGRGPMANYIAYAGSLHAEPVLLSKAVADHFDPHHLLREVA